MSMHWAFSPQPGEIRLCDGALRALSRNGMVSLAVALVFSQDGGQLNATDRGDLQAGADLARRGGGLNGRRADRAGVAVLIGLSLFLAVARAQDAPPPLDEASPCGICSPAAAAFRAGDYSALEEPIIDPGCDCPFPDNMIPQSRLLPNGAWPDALFERNRMLFTGEAGRLARAVAQGWTPLHGALNRGSSWHPRRHLNPEWLDQLLDAWPDALQAGLRNAGRRTGWTPLHSAASRSNPGILERLVRTSRAEFVAWSNPGIVERLLARGASVHARLADGTTPLRRVARLEDFKALRAAGAGRYGPTPEGFHILHRATTYGDATTVQELLDAGLDPNEAASNGWAPLHYASTREVFEVLRAAGADLHARTNGGQTVLHQVASFARSGGTAIVRELLDAGLDPNAVTSDGLTPLHYARTREIFEALREGGADVSVLEAAFAKDELEAARTNRSSRTRLNWAIRQVGRYLDASWLPRLRAVNPDFYAVPGGFSDGIGFFDRHFALHHAAQANDDPAAIAVLLGGASAPPGFSVDAMMPVRASGGQWRPLALAARYNPNPAVVEALLAAGADANADEGLALYYAAQNETPGAAEIVQALLEAGVDVDSRRGPTSNPTATQFLPPVYAAAMTQNPATLDALIAAGANIHGQGSTAHYSLLADVLSRGRFDCGYGPVADRLRAAEARAVRFTESGEVPFTPGPPVAECVSAEIRALVASGTDLDVLDAQGFTALHRAASAGRFADVRALVEAGADIDARSRGGRLTALQVAVWRRADLAVVNALLAARAEVDAADARGWTALHWAARDRRTDPAVAEALLEAGADVNVEDNIGQTALQYAMRADIRHEAVAVLLRAAGGG